MWENKMNSHNLPRRTYIGQFKKMTKTCRDILAKTWIANKHVNIKLLYHQSPRKLKLKP